MPPTGIVPIIPHAMPNNGDISTSPVTLQIPAIGSTFNSQPMPTSPTGPPPPFPPISSSSNLTPPSTTPAPAPVITQIPPSQRTSHNNDLNDAQNISKILQSSIHNGNNTSTISAASNHHNSIEDSVNHKETSEKLQSRSKKKSPNQKAATKKNSVEKQQHVHTNGLVASDKKVAASKKINSSTTNGNEEEMDDEAMEKIKEENLETRSLAFKEIRRLGRDYSGLYEQLEKVKGTFEMRFSFIQMCIDEASRFRRKHMMDCIQEWWASKCVEENDNGIVAVVDEKKPKASPVKKKRTAT